jgi:homeobox protein cut-like
VSTLDTAASDLVTHQRDTLVQRKELAQKTKDFRKLDDAAKLGEIKALLKSYQSFIDLISNQSKSTQSAFLQIYSPLSEAPDPYPLLEASIDSFVTAQEVVPKLESENKHLQATVAKLTSQLEDAESQLERERSTRQSSQTSQDSKIKQVEASWKAVLQEKQGNWDAREKSLEEKVDNQERLLKELKASYEVSQRLGKAEDDAATTTTATLGASQQELDLVNQELDKANLRLADLEARNEQLRLDLVQSATSSSNTAVSVEDDPAFLRLRSENSQLLRKLDAQRYERDTDKSKLDSEIRALSRELASLSQDRESIKRKLDKCSDYDEVKQELDMLKVCCAFCLHALSTNPHSPSSLPRATPTTRTARLMKRASRLRNCCSPGTRSSPTS